MSDNAIAPRGATPNWRPAETLEDYLRNCREGLETYSDRKAARVLGWPRIELYRAKLMSKLPKPLFERLLAAGINSSKALANVALAFNRGGNFVDWADRCPHCGEVLRVRWAVSREARDVIRAWLAEGAPR
jgi:hypothetical protein